MNYDLRPCKYCGDEPETTYTIDDKCVTTVQIACACGEGVHAYFCSIAAATWNAMNLPEENS